MYVLTPKNYQDKSIEVSDAEYKFITDTFANMSKVQELLCRKVLDNMEDDLADGCRPSLEN